MRRGHRRIRRAVAALGLSAVVATSGCLSAEQSSVASMVNGSRSQSNLRRLQDHAGLDAKAQRWAEHLSRVCRLSHSQLASGAPAGWQRLGENVGYGPTIQRVHDAYLKSEGHRHNIMDRGFNNLGTGAAWGTCNGKRTIFTVQVFMQS